jgi:hypothetical protein
MEILYLSRKANSLLDVEICQTCRRITQTEGKLGNPEHFDRGSEIGMENALFFSILAPMGKTGNIV